MKIAIVNDAILAAEALRRAITKEGKHQVVWIARDGADALNRCQRERPDLILMDLFMPNLDGIEATKQIMARTPCAIVIATANISENNGKVFEAMGAGALDVVEIPSLAEVEQPQGTRTLLAKLDTINKLVAPPPPKRGKTTTASSSNAARAAAQRAEKLVVIGSSAGGPSALTAILGGLPANFPASVVIVQHVDKQFAPGLTAWFASHTKLQVRVAAEGDPLQPGVVYLAGRDRHLVLFSPTQLGYTSQPIDSSYCPSVDVFFRSVAKQWRGKAIGVLLTGMGRDGAEGLKALRDAGHHTIAQDKVTSAVYGMPKAAAELNAARDILALDKIAARLVNIATK